MNSKKSDMIEIFSSVQGEGTLIGLRQIFLRFHSCNLGCSYCDTSAAAKMNVPPNCAIEKIPGRREFSYETNPVSLELVLSVVNNWKTECPGAHHSISLTGGEPLLHVDTLKEWLPELSKLFPLYLETNGTLHDELTKVVEYITYISMDIKLPSTSGHSDLWDAHTSFIRNSLPKELFVKIVIDEKTEEWEIIKTCEIISSMDRKIPLILQPRTLPDGKIAIRSVKTLQLQETAGKYLQETRIIPQTHIFSGFL